MCGLIILEICPCVRDVAPQRFLRVVPDLKGNPAGVTGRVTHCVFVVPVTCDELQCWRRSFWRSLLRIKRVFCLRLSQRGLWTLRNIRLIYSLTSLLWLLKKRKILDIEFTSAMPLDWRTHIFRICGNKTGEWRGICVIVFLWMWVFRIRLRSVYSLPAPHFYLKCVMHWGTRWSPHFTHIVLPSYRRNTSRQLELWLIVCVN